jgi:hypothetical protein
VERKIKQTCEELKIDENDLENIISAQRLEREITRMEVMKIVKEEIEKTKN